MIREIIRFELQYRSKRPATYIYFGILLLMSFLAVTTDAVRIGGSNSLVNENSPFLLANMMGIMSAFMAILSSSIMGVAVLRDFDHNMEALMFVNPIKKRDYLFGRFIGSFIVLVFVFSGMVFGLMLGDLMWWREADKLGPFRLDAYWWPFLVLVLPNLFFSGALFFVSGALSRKTIMIYTQGIGLLVLYQIALGMIGQIENKSFAALLDPFGLVAFRIGTQYWTSAERNTLLLPLANELLYNRLIYMAVGAGIMALGYYGFSFRTVRNSLLKAKAKARKLVPAPAMAQLPPITVSAGLGTSLRQLALLSWFYFRMVMKEVPFLGIVISGLLMLIVNSRYMDSMYGTPIYPVTYSMLDLLNGSFGLFFLIIVVLYSGELVWKERDVRVNLIYDATPMPDFLPMLGKFLGMTLVICSLLTMLIFTGVGIQAAKGYYQFDLGVYFSYMFSKTLFSMLMLLALGFFIQVAVNNKFLGFAVMILFFILTAVLSNWGLEHGLFQFGEISIGTYSDMNSYGHFVTPFSWYSLYWFGFSAILFGIATVFSVRGTEAWAKARLKAGKVRVNMPVVTFVVLAGVTFLCSGGYIYYNTSVVNKYRTSDAAKKDRADYEKALKKYEWQPSPSIVATNLKLELYPSRRDFEAEGYYLLVNKTGAALQDVHLQMSPSSDLRTETLTFQGGATVKEAHEQFKYYIYELAKPLQPGDTLRMDFRLVFDTKGFVDGGSDNKVVFNGTFFNNGDYLPTFGYNSGFELTDRGDRKEQELEPEKERMLPRDDPRGRRMNLFGDDAGFIDFEIVVGTEKGQIAVAPGYLQRQWDEDGRTYFHYKMDVPMINFFSVLSADYTVARDKWVRPNGEEVPLEIYYHASHQYNLESMMRAMKHSFDYYSTHFSPYQFRQMRILEFPRYASFAQSFANTVPFSEGIGFILQVEDSTKDLDMAYYVTSHELAHQWWGHQVTEAGVQGNAMLSETMSQYSALMVMKAHYSQEQMQKFLKYELDSYLRGRTSETKKEMPLELVEGQGYIHYRKGSLVMYALQDYIGEDSVNAALRRFIQQWSYADTLYPTSLELKQAFREVTPDSLQYLITDLFETITLYDNRAENVRYAPTADGRYEVEIEVFSQKIRADSLGQETVIPVADWIDVGVFAKDEQGEDKLVYLKKHKIDAERKTFTIVVDRLPSKAGIDPINKLIDRISRDNAKTAVLRTES